MCKEVYFFQELSMVARAIIYSLEQTHTEHHSLKPSKQFARPNAQHQRQNAVRSSEHSGRSSEQLTERWSLKPQLFFARANPLTEDSKQFARANQRQNYIRSTQVLYSLEPSSEAANFQVRSMVARANLMIAQANLGANLINCPEFLSFFVSKCQDVS